MTLDLGTLFTIAEKSLLLDVIEAELRQSGHTGIADRLLKLQQDCGLEIDREMSGSDEEPAPGSQTAALRAAYEPTSPERLVVIHEAAALTVGGSKYGEMKAFAGTLPAFVPGNFSQPAPSP